MSDQVTFRRARTASPGDTATMTVEKLREMFLLGGLFEPGKMHLVQSELDRLLVGGIMPLEPMPLPDLDEVNREAAFLANREAALMNIGGPGVVRVGDRSFELETMDCLYIGRGETGIVFEGPEARYFFVSAPAWTQHPTTHVSMAKAAVIPLGEAARATKREIRKYIHPEGVKSCQLMMGFTELETGSVWNTNPPHVHERRSEIYLYTGLEENDFVIHLMGEPDKTRHLLVREGEAVLSPPWSVHMGAGTKAYRFIWIMAGENQEFTDMQGVPVPSLR